MTRKPTGPGQRVAQQGTPDLLVVAACLFFVAIFFAACQTTGPFERSSAPPHHVLRVGTSGAYPPFSLRGKGDHLTGFDIEVARQLARDWNMRLEFVPFTWPALQEAVRNNEFDIAMGGITWRPDRSMIGYMSRAVAAGGPCLVGDPAAATLAVNKGGILERWVKETYPDREILTTVDNLSLPTFLADGRAQAFVTDSFEVAHLRPAGTHYRCEPATDRKVYWVAPNKAKEFGPRLDQWLAAREENLQQLRKRYLGGPLPRDETDHLIDLIARRLELMPDVARAKKKGHGATINAIEGIEDLAQEARVLAAIRENAAALGLAADPAAALFQELIALAKRVQTTTLAAERTLASEPLASEHLAPEQAAFKPLDQLRAALADLSGRILESLAAGGAPGKQPLTLERAEVWRRTLTAQEIDTLWSTLRTFADSHSKISADFRTRKFPSASAASAALRTRHRSSPEHRQRTPTLRTQRAGLVLGCTPPKPVLRYFATYPRGS